MTCNACGAKSCYTHEIPWHDGMTCDAYEEARKAAEKATEDYLQRGTKSCPKCGVHIEKNGGCDHMSTSSRTRQTETEEVNIEMYDLEAGPLAEGSANTNARASMSLGGFFKEVNSIRDMIRAIRDNMLAIADLYRRTIDNITEDESMRMSRQLGLFVSETSRISLQVGQKLKLMEFSSKSFSPGQDQTQMRVAQYAALVKQFMDTMSEYRQLQIENQTKYKNSITRLLYSAKPDATEDEVSQVLDADTRQGYASQILSINGSNQGRSTIIMDRQRDIASIGKSINELNKLLLEMQTLVIEKDTPVPTPDDRSILQIEASMTTDRVPGPLSAADKVRRVSL
ncbi:1608_t:CDS:2 [Paraglomus occultum]|uniref:1608_t:CDS:1 n=1 Tax=Paraglomus occultum TaxID=144539 RepID=A0A9N9AJQ4_9GLOM|nr:1608_t:CDS:2 [Paraglomus occultum]